MRPARFLLVTSIIALAVSAIFGYLNAWTVSERVMSFEAPPRVFMTNAWWSSMLTANEYQFGYLMFFGGIGLMLWTIWRDDKAEWTVAASSSVKLAALLMAAGILVPFVINAVLTEESFRSELYLEWHNKMRIVSVLGTEIMLFGMALWMHALASNQIPRLIEIAVLRRAENIGLGLILFVIGFISLALPDLTALAPNATSFIPGWISNSIGSPLLFLSFSLFSMAILAKHELKAQELTNP